MPNRSDWTPRTKDGLTVYRADGTIEHHPKPDYRQAKKTIATGKRRARMKQGNRHRTG